MMVKIIFGLFLTKYPGAIVGYYMPILNLGFEHTIWERASFQNLDHQNCSYRANSTLI